MSRLSPWALNATELPNEDDGLSDVLERAFFRLIKEGPDYWFYDNQWWQRPTLFLGSVPVSYVSSTGKVVLCQNGTTPAEIGELGRIIGYVYGNYFFRAGFTPIENYPKDLSVLSAEYARKNADLLDPQRKRIVLAILERVFRA